LNGVTSAVKEPRKLVLAAITQSSDHDPGGSSLRTAIAAVDAIDIGSHRALKAPSRALYRVSA
jgi:hypothetical protein